MVGAIRKLSDLSKDVKSLINMITHKRAKSTFRQASGGDDNQFGKTMTPVDFAHRLFLLDGSHRDTGRQPFENDWFLWQQQLGPFFQ